MEERIIKDINNLLTQLFYKMKEEGYEWDSEKKELRKIVAPIFKIGDTIIKKHNSDILYFGSFTITDITGGKYWYNDRIICDITEQDKWEIYEPVRQNTAWSEEDEYYLNSCITKIEIDIQNWEGHGKTMIDVDKEIISWLKSLKERYTWKPSDEQMKALDIAISCGIQLGTWEEDALKSLQEQLKKLRVNSNGI